LKSNLQPKGYAAFLIYTLFDRTSSAVDVVLGGYHLAGKAMEPRVEPTVRDLKTRIEPHVVAPGHCTGWRAKASLANTFSPGRYAPSVVGALYRLSASVD